MGIPMIQSLFLRFCFAVALSSLLVASVSAQLVELVKVIPSIKLDIRYATKNNFTGKVIYPSARCFLQKKVADALALVVQDLLRDGLGLKVFDGYRPQFYFRTTDVTGSIKMPEGVEMVMPGDNVNMDVELITPIAMEEGLRFAIREGGRTVGAGVVTKIIE